MSRLCGKALFFDGSETDPPRAAPDDPVCRGTVRPLKRAVPGWYAWAEQPRRGRRRCPMLGVAGASSSEASAGDFFLFAGAVVYPVPPPRCCQVANSAVPAVATVDMAEAPARR